MDQHQQTKREGPGIILKKKKKLKGQVEKQKQGKWTKTLLERYKNYQKHIITEVKGRDYLKEEGIAYRDKCPFRV